MPKVAQAEFDRVLGEVERKTCFRFVAGCLDSSAFMQPVDQNGVSIATPVEMSWKQLVALSELPEKPK